MNTPARPTASERDEAQAEARVPASALAPRRVPLEYGQVIVIGGGCYGSWYVQQLDRAMAHGALQVRQVIVVDHDARCRVGVERSQYAHVPLTVVGEPWVDFLDHWLSAAATRDAAARDMAGRDGAGSDVAPGGVAPPDMIVPSPLMPHLLLEWLEARARERWPARAVTIEPLRAPPNMPWQRAAPDGRHYVSFAEWMCPVNCIEPARCPATRGPRDWSMPPALTAYVQRERDLGHSLCGPIIFQCLHRTWGVGMIDVSTVVSADRLVASEAASGPARFLVGTVSHCHGALGVLRVE